MVETPIDTFSTLPIKARCSLVFFGPDRGKFCELRVLPLSLSPSTSGPSHVCRDFRQFEEDLKLLCTMEEVDRQNPGKFPHCVTTDSPSASLGYADARTRLMQVAPGTEGEFLTDRKIGLDELVYFGWRREVIQELFRIVN